MRTWNRSATDRAGDCSAVCGVGSWRRDLLPHLEPRSGRRAQPSRRRVPARSPAGPTTCATPRCRPGSTRAYRRRLGRPQRRRPVADLRQVPCRPGGRHPPPDRRRPRRGLNFGTPVAQTIGVGRCRPDSTGHGTISRRRRFACSTVGSAARGGCPRGGSYSIYKHICPGGAGDLIAVGCVSAPSASKCELISVWGVAHHAEMPLACGVGASCVAGATGAPDALTALNSSCPPEPRSASRCAASRSLGLRGWSQQLGLRTCLGVKESRSSLATGTLDHSRDAGLGR
jgi:hypothetical protein